VKDDEDNMGTRFQDLRRKNYETQEEFSVAAECSREYVSKIETNKTDPSLSMLKQMAPTLGMKTWQLVKYLLNE
jgi:transcriptional regulator with XRE-family HTH domain